MCHDVLRNSTYVVSFQADANGVCATRTHPVVKKAPSFCDSFSVSRDYTDTWGIEAYTHSISTLSDLSHTLQWSRVRGYAAGIIDIV